MQLLTRPRLLSLASLLTRWWAWKALIPETCFIVMVSVCVVGVFWMVYVGFVSGEGCLMVGVGHLAVFLIVF